MVKGQTKKITFNYLERAFYLPSRTFLKKFILELFREQGVQVAEVNYIFCSDNYLLRINQDFLSHNTYTDIITFQYNKVGEAVRSDIYISVDRVRDNATDFNVSFRKELYRVLFHGALHLCGYKDKTPKHAKKMRLMEDLYVGQYVSRET